MQTPAHILQFHQEANSPYLYEFAQDEWEWIENNTRLIMVLRKQTDTKNMNKSNYTCYEDNSNTFMHCMENYYSRKLGCTLPWSVNNISENNSMTICKGKEKFNQYKNIAMNILKPEENNELINEGCFIPDCVQISWKIKKEIIKSQKRNGELVTGFQYEWFEHSKVLVREEVQLYTLINFFAEVGGYLGLLLGESLLSYIITSSKWVQVVWVKFKSNCCKKSREETVNPS